MEQKTNEPTTRFRSGAPPVPMCSKGSLDLKTLIRAANANKSVLEYRMSEAWWSSCWTEAAIARNPPARVEFEHALVFGSLAEARSMRDGKSGWGALVKIEPLRSDDFLHPTRITYQLKASSKMRQRWEFRDSFKHTLGRHRRLVSEAMRLSKKRFLGEITESERSIIQNRLNIQPDEFWRAVRNGERYGADGIHRFVKELKERTDGYELNFMAAENGIADDVPF